MAYRIGLTGGIGSGKSTVSAMFSQLGVPVIDADKVARTVVEPGSVALERLKEHFGKKIIKEGALDRRLLRDIIFSDEPARKWVERLLHPYIQTEILRRSEIHDAPYVVLEVPLLIEAGYRPLVDRVLVVDAAETLQIDRVVSRDQVLPSQVKGIIATQMSAQERLQQADDVLENFGDIEALRRDVERLHQTYLEKSRAPS